MAKKMFVYGGLLLLGQALAGCSGEPAPPPVENRAAEEPPRASDVAEDVALVVAFGDSLFAGYGLAQDEGFAPALERALEGSGISAKVVNAGVSGDTTAGGRQRLAFVLDGLDRTPDLVIISLGGNDMLRGLDPAVTRANLDAMLAELKRLGIKAMLAGMIAPANMGADYVNQFNAIYPDLSAKYDAALYPFLMDGVIQDPSLMLDDGIHPNAAGVEKMADAVADAAAPALKAQDPA